MPASMSRSTFSVWHVWPRSRARVRQPTRIGRPGRQCTAHDFVRAHRAPLSISIDETDTFHPLSSASLIDFVAISCLTLSSIRTLALQYLFQLCRWSSDDELRKRERYHEHAGMFYHRLWLKCKNRRRQYTFPRTGWSQWAGTCHLESVFWICPCGP